MTKSEYRKYIQSEYWQQRRKQFLSGHFSCQRCKLPSWAAIVAYDQGLHVHHKNYLRLGCELEEDLEALCRRCHEVETFGNSALKEPTASLITQYDISLKSEEYSLGFNDAIEWVLYLQYKQLGIFSR